MMRFAWRAPLLVLPLAFSPAVIGAAPERTDEAPPKPPVVVPDPGTFVRLVRDEDGAPTRLQTAIVRYGPIRTATEEGAEGTDEAGDDGVVVELVAAVHVADRRYYKDLDERFRGYDALLYELVKPDGAGLPDGRPDDSEDPFSMLLQMGLDHVGLASQTDHIDYTRANFVHADLSPAQMMAKMEERGDDVLTIALGVVADSMRQQNLMERRLASDRASGQSPTGLLALEEIDPFELLFSPDGPIRMKRLFAEQLAGEALATGLGPTLETLLIDDRNEACMNAFRRELAKGTQKIGVFYGAAHMRDLDRRLREEFGLERRKVGWLTAWDLR